VKVAVATNARTSMETSIEIYGHPKKQIHKQIGKVLEKCVSLLQILLIMLVFGKRRRGAFLALQYFHLGPRALAYVYGFGHRCFKKYIRFNLAQECAMQG
jgi:hypothetical protein